jgi:hypothetical protein
VSAALVPVGDLRLSSLSAEEQQIAEGLHVQLEGFNGGNQRQAAYYEARQRVRDLGIAIPPHLRNLEAAIGWPAMAVDVLGERLVHDGWMTPDGDDRGIPDVVEANKLNREFRSGRVKAMTYGIAFGVVGAGGPGEPDPLVTVEPPTRMTVSYDRRRKQVTEALLVSVDDHGQIDGATLWYRDQIVELGYDGRSWTVEGRSRNRLGRPPVVRLVNRYSVGEGEGASEITRPVRAATDHAVRTIVAMEVSRDFYAAPKFWLLGADQSSFQDRDGNPKTAWDTYLGVMNAISRDEEGNVPDLKTFPGASPTPFLEQLRGLAQIVSAETALPISYLGLVHDANPASADAALVAEARLNIRTEQRQADFGEDEGELMRLALWVRDGADPGVTPMPMWRPAATPTLAAAADAAQKLVGAGVLPADSEVTQKRVGLSEDDRRLLADERRRARASQTVSALAAAAEAARADSEVAGLDGLR